MEQRDLLKDQIEQLGKVLAKILSDFLGFKSDGNVAQGIEISNERLQAELDIDIKKLVLLDKSELKEYLNSRKLKDVHLETLSEYLTEIGKTKTTKVDIDLYLKKAIELLDYADETTKTISFDRVNKERKIEMIKKAWR